MYNLCIYSNINSNTEPQKNCRDSWWMKIMSQERLVANMFRNQILSSGFFWPYWAYSFIASKVIRTPATWYPVMKTGHELFSVTSYFNLRISWTNKHDVRACSARVSVPCPTGLNQFCPEPRGGTMSKDLMIKV